MVRIYRIAIAHRSGYELVDFVLDPSCAASIALKQSASVDKSEYVFVSQLDVYPNMTETHEFLRVDGQSDSARQRDKRGSR